MRFTQFHPFKGIRQICAVESRVSPGRKLMSDQVITFDGGIHWFLPPDRVPGAKDVRLASSRKKSAITFHDKFRHGTRFGKVPWHVSNGTAVRQFTPKVIYAAMDTAFVRDMLKFQLRKCIRKRNQAGRKR